MTNLADADHTVLIAEYTLGLLNQEETAQAQALLNSDPQAVVIALKWEGALLDLADRLDPAVLPDNLWQEISNALDFDPIKTSLVPTNLAANTPANSVPVANPTPVLVAETPLAAAAPDIVPPAPIEKNPKASIPVPLTNKQAQTAAVTAAKPLPLRPEPEPPAPIISTPPAPAQKPTKKATKEQTKKQPRPTGWRLSLGQIALAGVILLTVVVAALALLARTPAQPPVTVIEVTPKQAAILQAPGQSSTPGWVVTISPSNDVQLNPQVHTDIPEDASVQLWTYNKHSPTPRSLGLIDPNQPVTVPAALMGAIGEQQFFEMTQEAAEGSVSGLPSGPVLFIGRIVTFG